MARENHLAAISETMTPEETSMMEADRNAPVESPELPLEQPEPTPEHEPELDAPVEQKPQQQDEDPVIDPADIDPKTGKARKVNYGAFHSERAKRQEAERNLATLNGRLEVLAKLAQGGAQQQPKPQAETPEIPDINTDPVGHFEAKDRIRQAELDELRAWRQAEEGQRTQMTNVQRITEIAQTQEAEFSKATPDYPDAFQHLRTFRDNQLLALGKTDPAERAHILRNEALQIAAMALQSQRNPAQVVYELAKASGYVKKAAAPANPDTTPDATKIAKIAKGQDTAQGLGKVNGAAPSSETSVDALLKMSDADFAKATEGDNWRRLLGG